MGRGDGRRLGPAIRANAEQQYLVPRHREPLRDAVLHVRVAPVHIEHARADVAAEMVVVIVVGALVPRRLAGQLNADDLAGLYEPFDLSIHGRNAESGDSVLSGVENFGRAERPVGADDRVRDGGFLVGLSGHGSRCRLDGEEERR